MEEPGNSNCSHAKALVSRQFQRVHYDEEPGGSEESGGIRVEEPALRDSCGMVK